MIKIDMLAQCSNFDEAKCPDSCAYLYQFRLDHVFRNAADYVRLLEARRSKEYPKGYLQISSCRRYVNNVKIIGV